MQLNKQIKTTLTLAAAAACSLILANPAFACNPPQPGGSPALRAMAPGAASLALANKGIIWGDAYEPRTQAEPGPPAGPNSIVGLWLTNYIAGGQVVDAGYEAWHSDGTEILIDIAPPATDNVCIGVYTSQGPNGYSLTHPSWTFDISGNLTGTAMITNKVTLSKDGNKFTGTFTVDTFDLNGHNNGHFEGQISATRIKP